MESTFIMIKPNGVSAGLTGEIISRYEKSRLSLRAIKLVHPSTKEMEGFYAEHSERPFFGELTEFMSSGPIILAALHGENAVENARKINGATNPAEAEPGTIRFDYAPDVGKNIVHSSDSVESAEREINYWFTADELVNAQPVSFKVAG